MNNPELYKGSMCIAAGEGAQWNEYPVLCLKGAKHDAVFKATIACGIIEVLYRDLVHSNDHRTIFGTRFERAFVVLLLTSPRLTTFACGTRRLMSH